jgi:hypothetical protein
MRPYKADKDRKQDVISLRLSEERTEVLERHRMILIEQLKRPVTLSEAAFLVLDDRIQTVERETSLHEFLKNPAESLWKTRERWESEHTLTLSEWDFLVIYLQAGAEEHRQVPPVWQSEVPSRESFLELVKAFEALLGGQKEEVYRQHLWYYFANLGGHDAKIPFPEDDAARRLEAVLRLIALRKEHLISDKGWQYPGSVGQCLLMAIQSETEGRRIDQALAPYWPTLWKLTARGHWLRHQLPIRLVRPDSSGVMNRQRVPSGVEVRGLGLSFQEAGGDLSFHLEFRSPRNFRLSLPRYPEFVEFHAMLENFDETLGWNGRHFRAIRWTDEESGEIRYSLQPKQQDIEIGFTDKEWTRLGDLFRQAWQKPEIIARLTELSLEYGEQG